MPPRNVARTFGNGPYVRRGKIDATDPKASDIAECCLWSNTVTSLTS